MFIVFVKLIYWCIGIVDVVGSRLVDNRCLIFYRDERVYLFVLVEDLIVF